MDNPRQKFLSLPQPITNWLTSDAATNTIIKINERLGLEGDLLKILPSLISRLVIKDLGPEGFAKELVWELNLEPNQIEGIIKEIYLGILRPIEIPLQNNPGINVQLIFTTTTQTALPRPAPSITPQPPQTTHPIYSPIKPRSPLPPVNFEEKIERVPPKPPTPTPPTATRIMPPPVRSSPIGPQKPTLAEEGPKPFMLHEEMPPVYSPDKKPTSLTELKASIRPSFTYAPPKPMPRAENKPKQPAKPVAVKIEGVKVINYPKKIKTNEIKLVHYSQFKTML